MAAESLAPAAGAKIVIVGAGVGGATAAKYLKIFNPKIHVTLIDRNPNFVRHYGSSELLTGAVTMEDLTVSYDALHERYGVKVVRDTIIGLDADRKTVIGKTSRYAYDKLIVSPGIELLYDALPGYSAVWRPPESRAAGSQVLRRSSLPISFSRCAAAARSSSLRRPIRTAVRPVRTNAPRS